MSPQIAWQLVKASCLSSCSALLVLGQPCWPSSQASPRGSLRSDLWHRWSEVWLPFRAQPVLVALVSATSRDQLGLYLWCHQSCGWPAALECAALQQVPGPALGPSQASGLSSVTGTPRTTRSSR